MPAAAYTSLSMASDVQTLPLKIPATKAGLAKWLEVYHSTLEMALKLGANMEARMLMMMLNNVTGK
eukprot:11523274-Prorocentrum_lima.AAC.1